MSMSAAPAVGTEALIRLQAAQAQASQSQAQATQVQAAAAGARKSGAGTVSDAVKAKAHAAAQDFESVFLSSMFKEMFTDIDGEGPFGGTQGVGIWRSFLTDQFAKSYAKAGGIGIAAHVYDTLLKQQGAHAS